MVLFIDIFSNSECRIYDTRALAYPKDIINPSRITKLVSHRNYKKIRIDVKDGVDLDLEPINIKYKKLYVTGPYSALFLCSKLFNCPLSKIHWTVSSKQFIDFTQIEHIGRIVISKVYHHCNGVGFTPNMTIEIAKLDEITSEIPKYKITSLDRLKGDICLLNPRIKLVITEENGDDFEEDSEEDETWNDPDGFEPKYKLNINIDKLLAKLPNVTRLELKFKYFSKVFVTINSDKITDLYLNIDNLVEFNSNLPKLINFESKYESKSLDDLTDKSH